MMDTSIGILLPPMIKSVPVAIINMNPKTAKSSANLDLFWLSIDSSPTLCIT